MRSSRGLQRGQQRRRSSVSVLKPQLRFLRSQKPGNVEALRGLLSAVLPELKNKRKQWKPEPVSTEYCHGLCQLLVDAHDVELVKLFFNKIFTNLFFLLSEKMVVVAALVSLLQTVEWKEVGKVCVGALGKLRDSECMLMALRVADSVSNEPARHALLQLAVQRADKLGDKLIKLSEAVSLLWKFGLSSENADFDPVMNSFMTADPSCLSQVIEDAAPYLRDARGSNGAFVVLVSIASKRIAWLQDRIQKLDQPFTWEVPSAEFPESAEVKEFLRGSDMSMVNKEPVTFQTLQDARNYAAKCMRKNQVGASFVMETCEQDGAAFVTITKTKERFSKRQHLLLQYKKEVENLTRRYEDAMASAASKKTRLKK